jgi:2-isopropylmalate synthase
LSIADISIAYIIKQVLSLDMPRRMQISFYRVIQELSEKTGKEITSKDITTAFRQTYHLGGSIYDGRIVLKSFITRDVQPSGDATPEMSPSRNSHRIANLALSIDRLDRVDSPDRNNGADLHQTPKRLTAKVLIDGSLREISGEGNGPLSSLLDALQGDLGINLSIREYTEHGVGAGSDVKAATYVELIPSDADPKNKTKGGFWGVGVDADITASGLKAVMSAANGYAAAVDLDFD